MRTFSSWVQPWVPVRALPPPHPSAAEHWVAGIRQQSGYGTQTPTRLSEARPLDAAVASARRARPSPTRDETPDSDSTPRGQPEWGVTGVAGTEELVLSALDSPRGIAR